MQFKPTVTVIGARHAQGDYEGTKYDNLTIFVQDEMDNSQGRSWGMATAEYKIRQGSRLVRFFDHGQYPMTGILTLDIVPDGKGGTKNVPVNFEPTPQPAKKSA